MLTSICCLNTHSPGNTLEAALLASSALQATTPFTPFSLLPRDPAMADAVELADIAIVGGDEYTRMFSR